VIPDPARLPMSSPYVMVWPQARDSRRALQSLRVWLRTRAAGQASSPA
jgi:hypothetical protein